jgi:RNA polymerase sigma factor (sigma-70 family)
VSDADLLARFVRGRDEAAFELLVWRHGPLVLGVCRRVLRNEQDAEDVFQATFLTLARKASSIAKGECISSWLYQVAYRIALRARRRPVPAPLNEQADTSFTPDPAERLAAYELRSLLDAEVNRLPEKYRAAFVLCYLHGKTNEAAARELGCPKGTVLSRLARARERLRAQLEQRGVALGAGSSAVFLAQHLPNLPEVSPALIQGAVEFALLTPLARLAEGLAEVRAVELAETVLRQMRLTALGRKAGWVALVLLLTLIAAGTVGVVGEGLVAAAGASSSQSPASCGCHAP